MAVQETAVEVCLPANVADDARATLQCTIVNLRDVSFQRRLFREDLAAFATCAPGTRILKSLQNSQNGIDQHPSFHETKKQILFERSFQMEQS